jgi:DNA-binding beta-propeller fold protein YncE
MKKSSRMLASIVTAAAVATMLAGCVTNPGQPDKNIAAEPSGPVFYPPLPNAPRVQYLTTISSERDLAVKKDSFADFIVGAEKEAQRLTQPYGIALDKGKLYVADTGAGGLAIFDLAQQRFSFVTGTGAGRIKRPINIRIDVDGTRYVTDTGRDQVLVFDRDDHFVRAFGVEDQFRPVDLAIVGNRLYVADILHHQIQVLDKATGHVLFKFGKPGSGEGELFHPTNIAVGPDGDIYVVETSNFRVQRFTAEGTPVRTYGSVGSTVGSFARPKGIAVDKAGRLLVGDAAFQNVQIFDNNGKLLMYFGQTDGRGDGLNLPTGVSVDYDNIASFRRFADPKFAIDYLILVASQFGPNKIDIFGFGKMIDMDYSEGKPATSSIAGPVVRPAVKPAV